MTVPTEELPEIPLSRRRSRRRVALIVIAAAIGVLAAYSPGWAIGIGASFTTLGVLDQFSRGS